MTDFDRRTVEEFRANGGQAGGVLAGTPLVLIHHIGARSGIEHVTPLAYSALDGGSIAIAASNGGSPKQPAWYHNLKANPAITVELGTQKFEATAEEQAGPARADLWTQLVAQFPDLATFAASTDRPIPLFLLRRQYRLWVYGAPAKSPRTHIFTCSPWNSASSWVQIYFIAKIRSRIRSQRSRGCTPWFLISSTSQPAPTPNKKRPPDR